MRMQLHIWLYNSRGQLALRVCRDYRLEAAIVASLSGDEYPGIMAMRTLADHLGIIADIQNLRLIHRDDKCFVYICKFEGDLNTLTLRQQVLRITSFADLPYSRQKAPSFRQGMNGENPLSIVQLFPGEAGK